MGSQTEKRSIRENVKETQEYKISCFGNLEREKVGKSCD